MNSHVLVLMGGTHRPNGWQRASVQCPLSCAGGCRWGLRDFANFEIEEAAIDLYLPPGRYAVGVSYMEGLRFEIEGVEAAS